MRVGAMNIHAQKIVSAVVFVSLLAIGAYFMLKPAVSTDEKKSAEMAPQPTTDEALKALRRVSPNALQICFDGGVGGYLFQFEEEGQLKWWFVNIRPMWKSQNGTWLTKTIADNEWVQVGADVTGLTCDIKQ
jgi:hypothetical protein